MPRRNDKLTPRRRQFRYAGRKTALSAATLLAIAALVLADRAGLFGQAEKTDADKYHAKTFRVAKVVDGDTLDLDIPDGKHGYTRVRLWGVDTPETVKPNTPVQHFGPEASQFSRSLAAGQTVRIELDAKDTRDRHGRLLAFLYLADGRMLNRLLVEEGYAYADPRFNHAFKGEFARLMDRARKQGIGLWRTARPDDLPYYLQSNCPPRSSD